MHCLVGQNFSKTYEVTKIRHKESSERNAFAKRGLPLLGCLSVCLPKCFLILRAGPDLNCFQATDAFLPRRNETLRMSRCALKMAAAPDRLPFLSVGRVYSPAWLMKNEDGARHDHTEGQS